MSPTRMKWTETISTVRSVLAAAALLAAGVATAAAQSPAADWLWAAQTGPNLVTLVWQAVPGAAEYQIYLGDPSAPGTFLPRPVSRMGANSRRANLTGMARVTNGIAGGGREQPCAPAGGIQSHNARDFLCAANTDQHGNRAATVRRKWSRGTVPGAPGTRSGVQFRRRLQHAMRAVPAEPHFRPRRLPASRTSTWSRRSSRPAECPPA
jgi:hypothetical protein